MVRLFYFLTDKYDRWLALWQNRRCMAPGRGLQSRILMLSISTRLAMVVSSGSCWRCLLLSCLRQLLTQRFAFSSLCLFLFDLINCLLSIVFRRFHQALIVFDAIKIPHGLLTAWLRSCLLSDIPQLSLLVLIRLDHIELIAVKFDLLAKSRQLNGFSLNVRLHLVDFALDGLDRPICVAIGGVCRAHNGHSVPVLLLYGP